MKKEITCPDCLRVYLRAPKAVNVVLRRSGRWACQGCVTTKRNTSKKLPIGTERTRKAGYVEVMTPEGWKRRARLVMESIIGRALTKNDYVLHRNDDPGDDRPENLRLVDAAENNRIKHTGTRRTEEQRDRLRKINRRTLAAIRLRLAAKESKAAIARDLRVSRTTLHRLTRNIDQAPAMTRRVHLMRG